MLDDGMREFAAEMQGRKPLRPDQTRWVSDPVISGCYHRINAETLMNRAVSAKAGSALKTSCRRTM
jgi:hypothetical protein